MKKVLAVAIPTFNRPLQLARCLNALLPQLKGQCHLYIIDNNSDISADTVALPILIGHRFEEYTIYRNTANIGAVGNVLKCLEVVKEPWAWILGDDDVPECNSIRHIFDNINQYGDSKFIAYEVINFRKYSDNPIPTSKSILEGTQEFLESDALMCGSLISSGTYNMRLLQASLPAAYEWSSSFFPHLALIIASLEKSGGTVVYDHIPIVSYIDDGEPEPHKSAILLNIRKLSSLIKSEESRHSLMQSSIVKLFSPSGRDHLIYPTFTELTLSALALNTYEGARVIRRCRTLAAAEFLYGSLNRPFPTKRWSFILKWLTSSTIAFLLSRFPSLRKHLITSHQQRVKYASDRIGQTEIP